MGFTIAVSYLRDVVFIGAEIIVFARMTLLNVSVLDLFAIKLYASLTIPSGTEYSV